MKSSTHQASCISLNYKFVRCINPSENSHSADRKSIRSHVMRNRKLEQCQASYIGCSQNDSNDYFMPSQSIENLVQSLEIQTRTVAAAMPREISTLDPFDCLPIRMQPYMLQSLSRCKHVRYSFMRHRPTKILDSRYDGHL
jgi:hypothetical protein